MNSGSTHYAATMRALVGSWRKAWGRDDLPFLFVQLPGFQEHRAAADKRLDMDAAALARVHSDGSGHGFCTVRECQLEAARTIPDTGMAVTIDIGEA